MGYLPRVQQPHASFYRRPLPEAQIPFASERGRRLFREALAEGHMEGYFALAEQFHTQSEPAFCGLGTLVVALNALALDPGRAWKGPWRWYGEEMLDCCASLDTVRARGITLDQLGCLARCNGAQATITRASDSSGDAFRRALHLVSSSDTSGVLAVAYSRRALGQTGDGHFSPVAGYHAAQDMALILDVARFKYPPHWVPVPALFAAMQPVDGVTKRSRGWVHLTRGAAGRPVLLRFGAPHGSWDEVLEDLGRSLPASLASARPRSGVEAVRAVLAGLPRSLLEAIEVQPEALAGAIDAGHAETLAALTSTLRALPVYELARAGVGSLAAKPAWACAGTGAHLDELAAMLVLVVPEGLLVGLDGAVREELAVLRRLDAVEEPLRTEVESLRAQLAMLMKQSCCA